MELTKAQLNSIITADTQKRTNLMKGYVFAGGFDVHENRSSNLIFYLSPTSKELIQLEFNLPNHLHDIYGGVLRKRLIVCGKALERMECFERQRSKETWKYLSKIQPGVEGPSVVTFAMKDKKPMMLMIGMYFFYLMKNRLCHNFK